MELGKTLWLKMVGGKGIWGADFLVDEETPQRHHVNKLTSFYI